MLQSARRAREWRRARGMSQDALCAVLGDPGGQLKHWESGSRPYLPLRLMVRLSELSAIPLADLVPADDLELLRRAVVLLARDAASAEDVPQPRRRAR